MEDRVKPREENELLTVAKDITLTSHALALKISAIVNHMKKGATTQKDINEKDASGLNALHILVSRGEVEAVKVLIDENANLDYLSDSGETALKLAILCDQDQCASLLIEAGSLLEKSDESGLPVFSYAVLNNNFNITSKLIQHNVKITHPVMLEMMIKQQNANDPRVGICLDALHKQYPIQNQPETKSTSASQEIVIIPFMLDTDNHYEAFTADEKINLLATRISEVCEILKKQKPNATWIMGWREYGIRDVGKRSISDETRIILKETMKAISRTYPNLIIVAGTVLTRKEKKISDLPKILRYYDDLNWVETKEKSQSDVKERQHLAFHRDQLTKLQAKQLDKDQKIMVLANKARIYYRGTEKRHGKIAPYNETQGLGEFAVYQPGKDQNLNPIIKIDDNLSVAISICREMHPELDLVKKSHKKDETPLLHFVLSYSIPLPLVSVDATNAAIHLDRCYDPLFVIPRALKKSNVDINVYPIPVHKKVEKLIYRAKPVYPVQFQILDRIDEELRKSPNLLEKLGLEALKNKTMKILFQFYISQDSYKQYINYITSRTWFMKPSLINDIVSILKQGDVQHAFNVAMEEKLQIHPSDLLSVKRRFF